MKKGLSAPHTHPLIPHPPPFTQAVEFLPKPFDEMALRRAVNSAIGISRKRHCMQISQEMVRELLDTLTPSELVVAKMIARGYPTKLVADELGRSENTVKIHRHRVFGKLRVNSAASVSNVMSHVMDEEGGAL